METSMPEASVAAPAAPTTQQPGAQALETVITTPAAGGEAPGAAPAPELQPGGAAPVTAQEQPQPQQHQQQDPPEQGGVQKRISELTRARREAERRAQEAEAQAAAAFEALQRLQQPADPAPEELAPPTFETPEQFAREMAEYTQKVAARQAREAAQLAREEDARTLAQRAQQAQQERVRTEFQERVEQAKTRYQDFDDVVNNPDVPISVPLAAAIAQHQQGADVAYYLGTHVEEARRLATLPPALQLAELGVIAYKLANPPAAATSRVAPPIEPVRGAAGSTARPVEELSMDEYAARRGR